MNNYAFIDGANLHFTFENLSWRMDYQKLRIHLKDKYFVSKAYYFVGNRATLAPLYNALEKDGYTLILKQVSHSSDGRTKGNCDAELVLQAMIDKYDYDKAVIVTSDGDFACLVRHLILCDKLYRVIAPCLSGCSLLLKQASGTKIDFLDNARAMLEYK